MLAYCIFYQRCKSAICTLKCRVLRTTYSVLSINYGDRLISTERASLVSHAPQVQSCACLPLFNCACRHAYPVACSLCMSCFAFLLRPNACLMTASGVQALTQQHQHFKTSLQPFPADFVVPSVLSLCIFCHCSGCCSLRSACFCRDCLSSLLFCTQCCVLLYRRRLLTALGWSIFRLSYRSVVLFSVLCLAVQAPLADSSGLERFQCAVL